MPNASNGDRCFQFRSTAGRRDLDHDMFLRHLCLANTTDHDMFLSHLRLANTTCSSMPTLDSLDKPALAQFWTFGALKFL